MDMSEVRATMYLGKMCFTCTFIREYGFAHGSEEKVSELDAVGVGPVCNSYTRSGC